jgi:hypothetical protein
VLSVRLPEDLHLAACWAAQLAPTGLATLIRRGLVREIAAVAQACEPEQDRESPSYRECLRRFLVDWLETAQAVCEPSK